MFPLIPPPQTALYIRLCPLTTGAPRQRNMAQMKEQIKTSEKELNDEEIDNLSVAEFKTLVIRMLTELIERSRKMKKEMKATQSEIKENTENQQ